MVFKYNNYALYIAAYSRNLTAKQFWWLFANNIIKKNKTFLYCSFKSRDSLVHFMGSRVDNKRTSV